MSFLEKARRSLSRRTRNLEETIKARLEIDVSGHAAGIEARLRARLNLQDLPLAGDLAFRRGPWGWGWVRTQAYSASRFRKIALSQILFSPVVEGVALVLLPDPSWDAPVFAADFMVLPTQISVHADTYSSERAPLLSPLTTQFDALTARRPGPTWSAQLSSGVGLHAKVDLRLVAPAYSALTAALGCYLDCVATAKPGETRPDQNAFFSLFHTYGPRVGALSRLMGPSFAERYSNLMFE